MQAQDLIKRVAEYDEDLARDLQKFIGSRKLGLVYEESKPEYVRLWNKPVVEGDLVNILPPRGIAENLTDDADEHDVIWHVAQITDNKARLLKVESGELRDASLSDLVAVARFDQNIYCGLRETGRVERGGDKPYQIVINGENFHAVESLLFAYRGKVDCIYIDPPYNTGAKDWKYNNNYVGTDDRYRHSKWLTFMEDRLTVAKQLLNPENSVLICTIDEKEYLRLGLLLEKVFPAAHIQMISIIINPSGAKRDNLFSRSDEYAFIVLFGSAHVAHPEGNGPEKEVRWWYLRRTDFSSRRGTVKGGVAQFYPIYVDDATHKIVHIGSPLSPDQLITDAPVISGATAVFPIREDGVEMNWGLTGDSLRKLLKEGVVRVTPSNNKNQPYVFRYLSANYKRKIKDGRWRVEGTREDGSKIVVETKGKVTRATTTWSNKAYDAGQYGTSLLGSLIGPFRRFPFPKSLYAVEDTLRFFVSDKPNALIVDFFAGSGTTAHAVMRLNHQDGGHRRCICVTNNEVSADEQKELVGKGLRQGDSEWERLGICEYVTKPRITAAITGETPDGKPIEGDYKFTDEFPMADGLQENAVYYDLTYLEPSVVSADLAFDEIAPLLWMRAGSAGPMIRHGRTFELTDSYGVLFDFAYAAPFIRECREHSILSAFIVTDIDAEWRAICRELPGVDVVQLYKHYLRSFEIGAGR
ncbi:MAG: site-specific DNA-methyltransferase [Atopobiaceae bacterium]